MRIFHEKAKAPLPFDSRSFGCDIIFVVARVCGGIFGDVWHREIGNVRREIVDYSNGRAVFDTLKW